MDITTDMIKGLREKTGAGMMDCKKALAENAGDMEKATVWLREKGMASAAKKSSRIAAEGLVEAYIHAGGRIGVLVEVNIETDFAAKSDEFKGFVKDVAMQIAAMNPKWVTKEEIPADVIDAERAIYRAEALNEGKPEKIVDRIADGKMAKFVADHCLLEQTFIRDDAVTIGALLKQKIAKIGENISIRRFARFEMGEGLQKKEENFADEVMKQIRN
jgi:elongation factor Ts